MIEALRRGRRTGRRIPARLAASGVLVAGLIALGPGGPVGAATCAAAAPGAQSTTPFCGHPYEPKKTQDGTIYRSAVDSQGNTVDLALDVWEPVGDPPATARPALLWMHGGYFAFSDRTDNQNTIENFASRGFVVISIDYRLRPLPPGQGLSVPAPEAVQDTLDDAVAAVAWIHAHATALRIDRGAVIASGYSAGAITALGLAHKPTAVSRPGSSTPIAAAVSFSGLDLFGARAPGPDHPPVLMYNSDDDDTVPQGAARSTCVATARTGAECDLVGLHGQGHTSGNPENYQQSVAWLAAHGIDQLGACERFDVRTDPSATTTTTTTTTSTSTSTTSTPSTPSTPSLTSTSTTPGSSGSGEPPAATGNDAVPAVPVAASVSFTG